MATIQQNSELRDPEPSVDGTGNGINTGYDSSSSETGNAGNDQPKQPEFGAEPIKRGRGRPPKNGTGTGGGNSSGSGQKTGGKKTQVYLSAKTLKGLHAGFGLLVQKHDPLFAEIVQLSDAEADTLASGLSDVLQHYDMTVNPVLQAWFGLFAAAGMVYVPKFMLYNQAKAGLMQN